MFVLKRVLVWSAIVLLLVATLENGLRGAPDALIEGSVWVGRVAAVAALVWVFLASRWRESPTRGLGHGIELSRPGPEAEEL